MAALDDLISQIPDESLRERIRRRDEAGQSPEEIRSGI